MITNRSKKVPWPDLLLVLLLLPFAGMLIGAVTTLPEPPPRRTEEVYQRLDEAGVISPVTAVLLNFRSYDTLLEIGVLLLAVVACLALRQAHPAGALFAAMPADPVLAALIRLLMPVMVMVAGYLLWAGEHAPGGAFQAGAVVGAAGVLLLLGEKIQLPGAPDILMRAALAAGFGIFLGIGVAVMADGSPFLEYPRDWAGTLIILLETVLTLSIGVTLIALFAANPPGGPPSGQAGGPS
jgi:multisubunit Na+/H+ antiporter MnhB subunit